MIANLLMEPVSTTVTVAALVQDIPENGADVAHLDAVHSASILLGGEPSQAAEEASSGLTSHVWDISWAAGEGAAAHTASISLHHKKLLLGRLTLFSLGVEAQQIGARLRGHHHSVLIPHHLSPGPALVHLNFSSCLGRGVMVQVRYYRDDGTTILKCTYLPTRA